MTQQPKQKQTVSEITFSPLSQVPNRSLTLFHSNLHLTDLRAAFQLFLAADISDLFHKLWEEF